MAPASAALLLLATVLGLAAAPRAAAVETTEPAASAAPAAPERRIAITFDDLPWQHLRGPEQFDVPARHAAMIAALRAAAVPVTGFVNEGKLERDGAPVPARVAMLRDWLAVGADLGNHTFGHVDLHAVGIDAFTADIERGERVLRPLLLESRRVPRWFRHPYLRTGLSVEDRQYVIDFLAWHGYGVAPVTIDNSEWIWAAAYRVVLMGDADATNAPALDADAASGDAQRGPRLLARLRAEYVPYLIAKLDYYERQSLALLGRNPAQVLLLHANALNADTFVDLVDAIRARGYAVITLDEAMQDPAYRSEDGYTGAFGPSWIHRWAMAQRKPREFYAGEPETPQWVMQLAGIMSE